MRVVEVFCSNFCADLHLIAVNLGINLNNSAVVADMLEFTDESKSVGYCRSSNLILV